MKCITTIFFGALLSFGFINQHNPKPASEVPHFIKITNGHTTFVDSTIICELSLKNLPERMRFNNRELLVNAKEYEWSVYFDNDNNGSYDISFSVANWKHEAETESTGELLNYTQSNIWKINKDGGSSVGDLDAKLQGNKIILSTLNRNELKEITPGSKIKYQTYYNDGEKSYTDSLIIKNNGINRN